MKTNVTARQDLSRHSDLPSWSDERLGSHDLVRVGWGHLPRDRIEEARLAQREFLTRMLRSGNIDSRHYFDAADVQDHMDVLASPERFAEACEVFRERLASPPVERSPEMTWEDYREGRLLGKDIVED